MILVVLGLVAGCSLITAAAVCRYTTRRILQNIDEDRGKSEDYYKNLIMKAIETSLLQLCAINKDSQPIKKNTVLQKKPGRPFASGRKLSMTPDAIKMREKRRREHEKREAAKTAAPVVLEEIMPISEIPLSATFDSAL